MKAQVLKTALEAISKGGIETAQEQAVLLREAGFVSRQHEGQDCDWDTQMHQEYVAGQLLHIVDTGLWSSMNSLLNRCLPGGPWCSELFSELTTQVFQRQVLALSASAKFRTPQTAHLPNGVVLCLLPSEKVVAYPPDIELDIKGEGPSVADAVEDLRLVLTKVHDWACEQLEAL